MAGCANDVEKARAIFRWITVKNLNSLMFEDVSGGDTPLGKQHLCRETAPQLMTKVVCCQNWVR